MKNNCYLKPHDLLEIHLDTIAFEEKLLLILFILNMNHKIICTSLLIIFMLERQEQLAHFAIPLYGAL